MLIILGNGVLFFFKEKILLVFRGVEFVVLSFCDLTVFVFFIREYKYGETENRWLGLVCMSILGVKKKIKTV